MTPTFDSIKAACAKVCADEELRLRENAAVFRNRSKELTAEEHDKKANTAHALMRMIQDLTPTQCGLSEPAQGEESSDLGALLWILYTHQGASSEVGQKIRRRLGMGQFDRMSDEQIAEAEAFCRSNNPAALSPSPAIKPGVVEVQRSDLEIVLKAGRAVGVYGLSHDAIERALTAAPKPEAGEG